MKRHRQREPLAPLPSLAALEQRVHARVPRARFVAEHIVRRAVREERGIAGLRTFVPHTHCLAVPTSLLEAITSRDELAAIGPSPEGWVILLPRPDAGWVTSTPSDEVLRELWRQLFHASLDHHLSALFTTGTDGVTDRVRLLETIDRIGQLPMDEARSVLAEEGMTGPGADERRELVELIATWHELRIFHPEHLARWFPTLTERPETAAFLEGLVPVARILDESRPDGVADPVPPTLPAKDADEPEAPTRPERGAARRALEASHRARSRSLDVAAAVHAHRARHLACPGGGPPRVDDAGLKALHTDAVVAEGEALRSLGRRLATLVPSDPGQLERAGEWPAALMPLLPTARWGMARVEARLLHDLEKACHDAERETWDVDLGRVIRSFGRRPLKRRDAIRQRVMIVRSLVRAAHRLPLCRLDEPDRRRLKRLLGDLAAAAEAELRATMTPLLEGGLEASGLRADNLPERVARDKIVAELCDRLLARGFIAFSDLRDLVARGQLKLRDLRGPKEWLQGDTLLVLDRWCADHLDGAYRKGEVYRSGLQRLSSLLFANVLGRLLVRYLILPFGGAFFLVQGLEHILGPLIRLFSPVPADAVFAAIGNEMVREQVHLVTHLPVEHHYLFWSIPSFLATTAVLFALIHSPVARRVGEAVMRGVGRAFRFVFSELPKMVKAWPPIQRLIKTRLFELFWERLWRPARYALVPTLVVVMATGAPLFWLWVGAPLVLAFGFFLASRAGERFSEAFGDWLTMTWHYLQHELVPGLIAATLAFFKRLMDYAEIALYNVDQWLRYQRGGSSFGLALKAFFGFFWSIIAYLVRLMVNLVVEPQVNPIKHFPVVTVSHKVTIPTTLLIAHELKPLVGTTAANIVGGLAQFIIPGVCGFLVWEFKENWRLYEANRKPGLEPVIVGGHGEPVYRLLRLGFHSGTLPRIFRKLRKAERKGNTLEIRKQIEELHHVEEAMARFVERELKALLVLDGRIPEARELEVEGVRLTPARIAVTLGCRPLGEPLELRFEEQSRFLIAGLARKGFLEHLPAERREVFETGLAGLYKLSGVDLVREHIEGLLPGRPGETSYDIGPRGLVVWPTGFRAEIVYPLRSRDPILLPRIEGEPNLVAPAIAASDLSFKARPFPWARWTELWPSEPRPS